MIPDYWVGPLTAVAIFLAGQIILFFAFLWRQSLMVRSIQESMTNSAKSFEKFCESNQSALQVIHDRINADRKRLDRHADRLDEHGRQISHINGVLGVHNRRQEQTIG